MGEIIAERFLTVRFENQVSQATVRLGRPIKLPDNPDYKCPLQILGVGDEKVRFASGEDALQSLQLALSMIAIELHLRYNDYTFQWLEPGDGGGFSAPET